MRDLVPYTRWNLSRVHLEVKRAIEVPPRGFYIARTVDLERVDVGVALTRCSVAGERVTDAIGLVAWAAWVDTTVQ